MDMEERTRYIFGVALLLLVVLLWTGSNFVTQDVFNEGFNKPFMITYLNTASFSLYLVPFIWRRRASFRLSSTVYAQLRSENTDPPVGHINTTPPATESAPLTVRDTFELARAFVVIWFLANWTINSSLRYATVASVTILASTSGFFTLIIGRIFQVESFSITRVCAVLASFLGVVFVYGGDYNSAPSSPSSPSSNLTRCDHRRALLGDTLALLSAVFYAVYIILLKVRVGSEVRMDMQLFFGFVGLINICCAWVIGLLLHFTGVERLDMPVNGQQWGGVLLNMLITLLSDYIYVLAMLKTTPLIVTVGLSLSIPCALLGDALWLHKSPPSDILCGAVLVLLAFVAVGLEDNRQSAGQLEPAHSQPPGGNGQHQLATG